MALRPLASLPSLVLERIRGDVPLVARLTLGSVATYVLISVVFDHADMTGALTALLVIQASVHRTLGVALERVVAVLMATGLGILAADAWGLSPLTLALVVLVGLLLGSALGLKENFLEMPISAMLILSASQAGLAAEARILNTLIGAAVGLTLILLWPPPPKVARALEAVGEVAASTAASTAAVAEGLAGDTLQVTTLLKKIQAVQPELEEARATVEATRREYRLNHASGRVAGRHQVNLLEALAALEACLPQLQKLIIHLDARTYSPSTPLDREVAQELKFLYSEALRVTAETVASFGAYVTAPPATVEALGEELRRNVRHLKASEEMLMELATASVQDPLEASFTASTLGAMRALVRHLDGETLGSYSPTFRAGMQRTLEPLTRGTLKHSSGSLTRTLRRLRKITPCREGRTSKKF